MSETFMFEIEQIRTAAGARWLQKPERMPYVKAIGLDSREDLSGKVFIAIKGELHDGHDHLMQAMQNGAQLLMVETARVQDRERPLTAPVGLAMMQVDSTRKALGRIAHAHRQSLRGTKVIAVTGSSGKTTTKRLIHGVLSGTFAGTASIKSFNNDIGVPLTLLAAKSSDKYVIVEVGTNHPGEIASLARIAEPDIAVVTMIGRCHLEGLGSIEGVAREKGSLIDALPREDGVAIVNADYPLLRPRLKGVKFKFLFGEGEDADLRLTDRGSDADGAWFEVNQRSRFRLLLPGKHNAINALAAVAVGRRFGLDDDEIRAGLLTVKPEAMRMTPEVSGGVTFYNDAYNANPDSMLAALDTFVELAGESPRRVIVLGDMLELGEEAASLHREVATRIAHIDQSNAFAHLLLVGPHMKHARETLARPLGKDRLSHFESMDEKCIEKARKIIKPGDVVLVKASRGMGLERLIASFEEVAPPTQKKRGKPARQHV